MVLGDENGSVVTVARWVVITNKLQGLSDLMTRDRNDPNGGETYSDDLYSK